LYLECFHERWGSLITQEERLSSDPNGLVNEGDKLSIKALNGFSATAAAKVFEEEIREVVCLLTFIVCTFFVYTYFHSLNITVSLSK
jgi:hypothetical protein